MRPYRFDRRAVPREPVVLAREVQELAVAVVLGDRVRAAPIHAARHLPVLELERREPPEEVARDGAVPQPQQGRGRESAVADPGAGVGARARLDGGSVAVDEDPAHV